MSELLAGRYQLREKLGMGGVASVWSARDEQLGEEVAIKLLHPHLAGDAVSRERLRREVLAAHRIPGGGSLKIFDFVEEGEQAFLVLERAAGDLEAKLPLSLEEGLPVGAAVARTLQQAHSAGVLHRDIKPSNLLFLPGVAPLAQRVRLADFGLARLEDRAGGTATAALAGSVGYTAPEVYSGILDDPRSDQYALAVTIHELLTGQLPWGECSPAEILRKQLAEDATVSGELPPAVAATLGQALSRAPESRFPTLDAFAGALGAAARGESPPPMASGPLCPGCGGLLVRGLAVCPGCGRRAAVIPRGKGPYQARVYAPMVVFKLNRNNFDNLTFAEKQAVVKTVTETTGAPLKEAGEVDAALRRPIVVAADGLDRSGADTMVQRLRDQGLQAEVYGPEAPGRRWQERLVRMLPIIPAFLALPAFFGAMIAEMSSGEGPPLPVMLVPLVAVAFAAWVLHHVSHPRGFLAEGNSSAAAGTTFGKELEEGIASIQNNSVRALLGEVYRAAGALQEALSTAPENARMEGAAAAKEACLAALSLARRLEWVDQAQPSRGRGQDAEREEAEVRIRTALLSLAADLRTATTRIAARPEALGEAREAVDRLAVVVSALEAAPRRMETQDAPTEEARRSAIHAARRLRQ